MSDFYVQYAQDKIILWRRSVVIKDHTPQLMYMQIIFCMQIRVHDFFLEWRVILTYQTSVDTAISEPRWMLHHTATSDFCCQSNFSCSSSAALLLLVPGSLCCQWLDRHVLFPSVQPLCHKQRKFLQSCDTLWDTILEYHTDLSLEVVTVYQR